MKRDEIALQWEIERVLFQEARLLDARRYDDWLAMVSEKVRYWAPVRQCLEVEDFEAADLLPLFDDRKADLAMRIQRLETGYAHAERPPTRTRRLVSNVLVLGGQESSIEVSSSFVLTVSRWEGAAKIFSGCREDRWERLAENWLLAERRIVFDLSTTENMSFLV